MGGEAHRGSTWLADELMCVMNAGVPLTCYNMKQYPHHNRKQTAKHLYDSSSSLIDITLEGRNGVVMTVCPWGVALACSGEEL